MGEKAAGLWLRSRGARILRRNYRADSGGEVDIVYREGDVLVFCEVKTRTGTGYGPPSRAVNREKRRLIRRGARSWLRKLKREVPFRFDIMEVLMIPGELPEIRRLVGAFGERE